MKKIIYRLLPFFCSVTISVVFLLLCSKNTQKALNTLLLANITNTYYFGNMLSYAALLMTAGCGAAFANKGGALNLGGEGQIYMGGFTGCLVLNTMHGPYILVFAAALLCAVISAALMSLLSAFFKQTKGAEVLLTTYLISSAAIPVIDGFITQSKANTNTNMLSLPYINEHYHLLRILEPSPLTIFFFVAVIICLFMWYLLYKTDTGQKTLIWGKAPQFALFAGLSDTKNTYLTLTLSGLLHGLTGFIAVTGLYYTCHKGFYTGMGWNALSVSLIADSNPLFVIPASLVLSYLITGCEQLSLTQSLGFDVSTIIQSIILLSIAVKAVKK